MHQYFRQQKILQYHSLIRYNQVELTAPQKYTELLPLSVIVNLLTDKSYEVFSRKPVIGIGLPGLTRKRVSLPTFGKVTC